MDPQFMEDKALVQPTSEYTPMLGEVVIVPEELMLVFTVTAAKVDPARAIAAITRAIIMIFDVLTSAMLVAPMQLNMV